VIWLIAIFSVESFADVAPVVSNVQVQQQDLEGKVKITYDVVDTDTRTLTIMVLLSSDGGSTFIKPAQTCTGSVGWGIRPGKRRQIIWDAMTDMPNTFGENYQALVFASDGIFGEDGSEMLLISAGDFIMGGKPGSNLKETPQHTVFLNAFYIDKYEVTNAQYHKFWLADGGDNSSHRPVDYKTAYYMFRWPSIVETKPDNPILGVTWFDAQAYAEWAGKQLPTEAEWEKAARGTDARIWPWGNDFNLKIKHATVHANTWDGGDGYDNKPAPVNRFSTGVSPYGVHNMAGNVLEWCTDWFDADYYAQSPRENPTGPETGISRAIRGGSWYNGKELARCAFRLAKSPDDSSNTIGFRCVQEFDLNRTDEGYGESNLFTLDTRILPPWDVNRDGVVDIQDLALVSKNFGKPGGITEDVNSDGTIDIKDLIMVGHHLGE